MQNLNVSSSEKSVTQHELNFIIQFYFFSFNLIIFIYYIYFIIHYSAHSSLNQMTIGMIRL